MAICYQDCTTLHGGNLAQSVRRSPLNRPTDARPWQDVGSYDYAPPPSSPRSFRPPPGGPPGGPGGPNGNGDGGLNSFTKALIAGLRLVLVALSLLFLLPAVHCASSPRSTQQSIMKAWNGCKLEVQQAIQFICSCTGGLFRAVLVKTTP